MPADLYECANVILEIRPQSIATSTIPTSSLISTSLLSGPILPSSASSLPTLGTTTAVTLSTVVVQPEPQFSAYLTSTVLVTNCGATNVNCPVTTSLMTYAVTSNSHIPSTVSSPRTESVPTHSLPSRSSANPTTQSTTTVIATATQTFTSTITSCPPVMTHCPIGYSSISVYTSTVISTLYTCHGGCAEEGLLKEGCILRKRTRLLKKGEL